MEEKKEFEIVTHTVMNYLELFVVEMTSANRYCFIT